MTPEKGRDWRSIFLSIYRQTGIVALACRAAGISRTHAYRERQRSTTFAAAWADAEEDATEGLEAEARRRALASSDTLLIFLLKARRPHVYRDTVRIDVRREAEALAATLEGVTAEQLIAEAERILRARQ